MPRVPVAEQRVQAEALSPAAQSSVISPELQGAGARQQVQLGQSLGNAADAGFAILQRQKERDDATEIFNGEAAMRAKAIQFESDTKKARRADQAKGVTGDADKWWQKQTDQALETVTDPRRRRLLAQSFTRMRLQSLDNFQAYEDHQGDVAHDASWKASKALLISDGAADPKRVPDTIQQIKQKNAYYAAFKGLGADVKDALDLEDTTRLHTEVLQQMVRRDPTAAKAYFEANKGQIAGTSYDTITKAVDTASAATDGVKAAGEVWQALGPKSYNEPVVLDKMESAIRAKYPDDAVRQKAAISDLRERVAAHNSTQAEVKAGSINSVMDVYARTKSLTEVMKAPEWQTLGGSDRAKIEDYIVAHQTAAINRGNAALNRENLLEQRDQQAKQRRGFGAYLTYSNPTVLSGMSEAQVQALLPSLGNELTGHLMEKKRAFGSAQATLKAQIDKQDLDHIARGVGFKPDSSTENDRAAMGELQFRLEQLVDTVQANKKAPLTRAEKMELWKQEAARTVVINPGIFSSNREVPVLSIGAERLSQVVVPAATRRQIREALATKFRETKDPLTEPTEQNIQRQYLRSRATLPGLVPNGN